MRTATAPELAVLDGTEFTPIFRVSVKDSGGTWRDYSTLGGKSWIRSVTVDFNIDQPIASATVVLWRGDEAANSLSPLMTLSAYAGYIAGGRDIKIEAGAIASGTVPVAGDYKLIFEGVVDDYDLPGRTDLVLSCRDLGALLEDTGIETETAYGSGAGVALETVIQQILTDNLAASAPALYTPVSPAFLVKTLKVPAGQSVFEAVRKLASSKDGWELRYKYDTGTGTFRLTLYEPARSKTVADHTLNAGDEFSVTRFAADTTQVRNAIIVSYNDATTGTIEKITVSDAPSITKYKRRALPIDASGLPITTAAQATSYGTAILSDLKEPKADREADMPFFWPAELGDLYDYAANATHNDSAQKLAVVSVRHDLSVAEGGATARTKIAARGSVAGAFNLWLVLQAFGIVYVEPSWTEQLTEPAEGTARLTLTGVKDPQSRLISVAFDIDGVVTTVNAPGPYQVDATLKPFDPLPITYTVTRYDVLGIIRRDVYTVVLPISGAKLLENTSSINLLDAPGFYRLARLEQSHTIPSATFSVELQRLAPVAEVGTTVSGLILARATVAGDSARAKLFFTDGAGAVLATAYSNAGMFGAFGVPMKTTFVVYGVAIPAGTHKINIALEAVGALTGSLFVFMPVVVAGATPWNAQTPTWHNIIAQVQADAGAAAAMLYEQATRDGVRGVQGSEDIAMDVYDATGATKIIDAVTREILNMLLGTTVTDAQARAVTRMLAKPNSADPDTLDSVVEGALHGKTLLSALTSGQVDLSKAGVVNKVLANLARSGADPTTAAVILGYIANTGHLASAMQESGGAAVNRLLAKALAADPNTLDSVAEGAVYGKAVLAALTSGQIDLSKAGVINKLAAHILRTGGGATMQAIVANLTDTSHAAAAMQESGGKTLARLLAKALAADPDTADSVVNGTVKGVTNLTALTAGDVDFSKAGVVNRIAANLARSGADATTIATIVQFLANTGHAGATMQESGGKTLARLLAKALAADPDTADSVVNGLLKGVTNLTALTSGDVDLSKAGVTNKTTANIVRGAITLQTLIAQLKDNGFLAATAKIEDSLGTDRAVENIRSAMEKAAFQAGVSAGMLIEQVTRNGVRDVQGSEKLAADVYSSDGVTKILDAVAKQILSLLLAASVTDSAGVAVNRSLYKNAQADPNNLDSVAEGTVNGKTLLTALTSGQPDLSKAGVINKLAVYILRAAGGATIQSIVANLTDASHAGASMENSQAEQLAKMFATALAADPNTLDSVIDGTLNGKVLLAALSSGDVKRVRDTNDSVTMTTHEVRREALANAMFYGS